VHSFVWAAAHPLPAFSTKFTGENNLDSVLASRPFVTNGEATFSLLFWDLYKSELKTTSGRYPISLDKDQLIFHITYLTAISNKDLIKRTIEQWQYQGISKSKYQHYIKPLSVMWPNIAKGDSLAMLMQKDKSVFYLNNHYIGVINDYDFGQLFINIWLDETTSEPELRTQLLGDN
jgi:hypothetical protein